MIHCDEVFDILTRGPFPTGAPSDGIVEAHLNHCEGCRQLAEALRPAIELLQEAIAPEECSDLPRYGGAAVDSRLPWSDARSPSVTTKKKLALRRANRTCVPDSEAASWPWRAAAKMAAAACVGLVLAGMLRQLVVSGGGTNRGGTHPVAVAAHWRLAIDGRQWAIDQQLPETCLQPAMGRKMVAASAVPDKNDTLHLACCLGCHAAIQDRMVPLTRIGGFVQACQACH
jgi:hypothetical protein